jgi:hypothetical protein
MCELRRLKYSAQYSFWLRRLTLIDNPALTSTVSSSQACSHPGKSDTRLMASLGVGVRCRHHHLLRERGIRRSYSRTGRQSLIIQYNLQSHRQSAEGSVHFMSTTAGYRLQTNQPSSDWEGGTPLAQAR